MAYITECDDLTETGSLTSMLEAGWVGFGGPSSAVTTTNAFKDHRGNGGNYSLQLTGAFGSVGGCPLFTVPLSEIYHKTHWIQNGTDARDYILAFTQSQSGGGENRLGTLRVDALNRLQYFVEGTPTAVATSTFQLINGHKYTIETHLKVGNGATGRIEVRVDGSSVGWIPNTTVQTIPTTGDLTFDRVYLGSPNSNNDSHRMWFDDFCARTDTWCGETIFTAHMPNGAGALTQLTPSAGSNYQCVDEIPFSATDYVDATAPGQTDLYDVQDISVNVDTIKKVTVVARVVKSGASINGYQPVVRSAGTNYTPGSSHALPVAQEVKTDIIQHDPATGADWLPAAFNSAQFGAEFS